MAAKIRIIKKKTKFIWTFPIHSRSKARMKALSIGIHRKRSNIQDSADIGPYAPPFVTVGSGRDTYLPSPD